MLILVFFVVCIDKKLEKIYTSARKQMLISSLPPVITLHLKRFHQVSTRGLFLPFILSCRYSKQCLFFTYPQQLHKCITVLFLYFKAGMNLRKVNRHVDFPLILDLAPFCSASCKVLNY